MAFGGRIPLVDRLVHTQHIREESQPATHHQISLATKQQEHDTNQT